MEQIDRNWFLDNLKTNLKDHPNVNTIIIGCSLLYLYKYYMTCVNKMTVCLLWLINFLIKNVAVIIRSASEAKIKALN